MTKRQIPHHPSRATTKPQRHRSAHCLRILRALSAFIDDELPRQICQEIRQHLGACPRCEEFVASLRQTVSLCRHSPAPVLSPDDRALMREKILAAIRQ
ncbi:MAG: zf-HC2 domain-containing protein [Nitrospira sp.]|nr:zf-HC2 domain-containing protein [Nitrospira sp.]